MVCTTGKMHLTLYILLLLRSVKCFKLVPTEKKDTIESSTSNELEDVYYSLLDLEDLPEENTEAVRNDEIYENADPKKTKIDERATIFIHSSKYPKWIKMLCAHIMLPESKLQCLNKVTQTAKEHLHYDLMSHILNQDKIRQTPFKYFDKPYMPTKKLPTFFKKNRLPLLSNAYNTVGSSQDNQESLLNINNDTNPAYGAFIDHSNNNHEVNNDKYNPGVIYDINQNDNTKYRSEISYSDNEIRKNNNPNEGLNNANIMDKNNFDSGESYGDNEADKKLYDPEPLYSTNEVQNNNFNPVAVYKNEYNKKPFNSPVLYINSENEPSNLKPGLLYNSNENENNNFNTPPNDIIDQMNAPEAADNPNEVFNYIDPSTERYKINLLPEYYQKKDEDTQLSDTENDTPNGNYMFSKLNYANDMNDINKNYQVGPDWKGITYYVKANRLEGLKKAVDCDIFKCIMKKPSMKFVKSKGDVVELQCKCMKRKDSKKRAGNQKSMKVPRYTVLVNSKKRNPEFTIHSEEVDDNYINALVHVESNFVKTGVKFY